MGDELVHDVACHVDGNGEADTDIAAGWSNYRGVDSHDFAVEADEGSSRRPSTAPSSCSTSATTLASRERLLQAIRKGHTTPIKRPLLMPTLGCPPVVSTGPQCGWRGPE